MRYPPPLSTTNFLQRPPTAFLPEILVSGPEMILSRQNAVALGRNGQPRDRAARVGLRMSSRQLRLRHASTTCLEAQYQEQPPRLSVFIPTLPSSSHHDDRTRLS